MHLESFILTLAPENLCEVIKVPALIKGAGNKAKVEANLI